MSNIYRTVFERAFLIAQLPAPMTPADSHLQIFDNYIENTRIRLRKIRQPESDERTRVLEQHIPVDHGSGISSKKIYQIFLDKAEFQVFRQFEGREIRKNRYSYQYGNNEIEIDVFLGKLWGLNIAKVLLESSEEYKGFEPPDFAVEDISGESFFLGENLVEKEFTDVQEFLSR